MRKSLIVAVPVLAVAVLLWQFSSDEHRDEAVAPGGETDAGTVRELGPSLAGAVNPNPRIVKSKLADRNIPGNTPVRAILEDQRPPGEGEPAPLPAVGFNPQPPAPDPEFSPDPIEFLIQATIQDGAPVEAIDSLERSFVLAAMPPEERREAEALESRYEPPTPEAVEELIWLAYSNGEISAEIADEMVDAHWKQVEEEERLARERKEVVSPN